MVFNYILQKPPLNLYFLWLFQHTNHILDMLPGLLEGEVNVSNESRHVAEGVAKGMRQSRFRWDTHLVVGNVNKTVACGMRHAIESWWVYKGPTISWFF